MVSEGPSVLDFVGAPPREIARSGESDAVIEDCHEDLGLASNGLHKVFISGLSASCTSADLIDYFSQFGEVQDAAVGAVEEAGDDVGPGAACVVFVEAAGAEAVMRQSEDHRVRGRLIDVTWEAPASGEEGGWRVEENEQPSPEHMEETEQQGESGFKLFVGGLPVSCDYDKLVEHFSQFGSVIDAVVMKDRQTRQARGFGFVRYESSESVDAVMEQADAQIIEGKEVIVKRAVKGRNARSEATLELADKIFVGGLPSECTNEQLSDYFQQFGTVVDCSVKADRHSGKSRGFGFVTFASPQSVEAVMAQYDSHKMDGKWIEVKRAEERRPRGNETLHKGQCTGRERGVPERRWREESAAIAAQPVEHGADVPLGAAEPAVGEAMGTLVPGKVFVGGLPPNCSTEDIVGHFEQFGAIVDAVAMVDKETQQPRGFGFVTFGDATCVDMVMEQYNDHYIHEKWIEVKRADKGKGSKGKGKGDDEWHSTRDQRCDPEGFNSIATSGRVFHSGAVDTRKRRAAGGESCWTSGWDSTETNRRRSQSSSAWAALPASQPRFSSGSSAADGCDCKIFAGGLPLHIEDEALRHYFSQYGVVEDAMVARFADSGRTRGFGFITFNGPQAVDEVLRHFDEHYMDGQWIEVKRFESKKLGGRAGTPDSGWAAVHDNWRDMDQTWSPWAEAAWKRRRR